MDVIIPLLIIVVMSFVIWKAGEGFESASDYLGRNLSDGVKGATINAIGSSLPELLTTIFFLFILRNAEGFAAGLGTTAGSAVFNTVIIPFVVVVSVYFKFKKSEIPISRKVIARDGISLIIVNVLLLIVIKSNYLTDPDFSLTWKEGGLLMVFYVIYIAYLFVKMDKSKLKNKLEEDIDRSTIPSRNKKEILSSVFSFKFEQAFIGYGTITKTRAWLLLLFSMSVMSAGCYGLAESSIMLGEALDIPIFIVSVIIAAAATSVPDTFLSYKDSLKGNYNDSISNAFGSNIFDIGFAIGFPVLIFGLIYGDIRLGEGLQNDISELLTLLLFITVFVFVMFMSGSTLSLSKVFVGLILYLVFIFIILAKTEDVRWVIHLLDYLLEVSNLFRIK